jgi:hypothetical protein
VTSTVVMTATPSATTIPTSTKFIRLVIATTNSVTLNTSAQLSAVLV